MKFKAGDRVVTKGTKYTPAGSHGTIRRPWNTLPGNENYLIQFDGIIEHIYIGECFLEPESSITVTAPFGNGEQQISTQEASHRLFNQAETIKSQIKKLGERLVEIKNLKEENEQLRVQLAGVSVAAHGGTSPMVTAKKGDYGWSVAYQDTLDLRKNYDEIRRQVDAKNVEDLNAFRQRTIREHLWLNDAASEIGCDLDQVGNVIRKIKSLFSRSQRNNDFTNAKPESGLQGELQGCNQAKAEVAKVSEAPQREKIRETEPTTSYLGTRFINEN